MDADYYLTLMDDNGGTKHDLKVCDDVGEQIRTKLDSDEVVMVGMMIIMTTIVTNVPNMLILHVHFRLFKVFTESFFFFKSIQLLNRSVSHAAPSYLGALQQ